jgi:5-methylcytosine-specific restriction endonuclease McrA
MEHLLIELNKTILVLNASYEPINFTNGRRAVILLLKHKAQRLSARVIRLVNYVKLPIEKIMANKPSRHMVYKRDDHMCQYCGSIKNLTIDHVMPRSRGGKDTWENMVVACMPCNTHKGDKTPEEWGHKLYRKPKAPFNKMTLSLNKSNVSEWKEYVYG